MEEVATLLSAIKSLLLQFIQHISDQTNLGALDGINEPLFKAKMLHDCLSKYNNDLTQALCYIKKQTSKRMTIQVSNTTFFSSPKDNLMKKSCSSSAVMLSEAFSASHGK